MTQILAYLKGNQFDKHTQDGRSQKRYQAVILSAITALASSGITFITMLISVPLTIQYLGAERFGLWSTISSFVAVWGFVDLGIANGLINVISDADGKEDHLLAAHLISTAFILLSFIVVIVGIVFFIIYPWISWQQVYNVTSKQAINEAGPATAMFFAIFLLSSPLGIVQRVQIGFQEGFVRNLWAIIGSIAGLIGVLFAIYYKAELPYLILSFTGPPVVVLFFNNIVYFGFQRPWLFPKLSNFEFNAAKVILKTGFLYFVLQIASALNFQSGNIIIAQLLGASQVPQLAVPIRLFAAIPLLLGFIYSPLWPAYSEALSRNDRDWVRNTFWRSIRWGLWITVLPTALLTVFGDSIIHLWAGRDITPSVILLIGLGVQNLLSCFNGAIAALMNGARVIGFQVITSLIMGLSSIVLSLILVPKISVAGTVWGSVISQVCFAIIPCFLYLIYSRLIYREISEKIVSN